MPSYLFDVTFAASIRIEAETEEKARDALAAVDGALCNAGSWPNGDPALFEVFLDDEYPFLMAKD